MWESLWSCIASELIRCSTETTGVTAVSSVLTEVIYFSFRVKHKLFTSPSTNSQNLVPSSLSLHISLLFLNDCGNHFDHLVALLQLGHKHSETLAHTQWLQHCRVRQIDFFFLPSTLLPLYLRISLRLLKHTLKHIHVYTHFT